MRAKIKSNLFYTYRNFSMVTIWLPIIRDEEEPLDRPKRTLNILMNELLSPYLIFVPKSGKIWNQWSWEKEGGETWNFEKKKKKIQKISSEKYWYQLNRKWSIGILHSRRAAACQSAADTKRNIHIINLNHFHHL